MGAQLQNLKLKKVTSHWMALRPSGHLLENDEVHWAYLRRELSWAHSPLAGKAQAHFLLSGKSFRGPLSLLPRRTQLSPFGLLIKTDSGTIGPLDKKTEFKPIGPINSLYILVLAGLVVVFNLIIHDHGIYVLKMPYEPNIIYLRYHQVQNYLRAVTNATVLTLPRKLTSRRRILTKFPVLNYMIRKSFFFFLYKFSYA